MAGTTPENGGWLRVVVRNEEFDDDDNPIFDFDGPPDMFHRCIFEMDRTTGVLDGGCLGVGISTWEEEEEFRRSGCLTMPCLWSGMNAAQREDLFQRYCEVALPDKKLSFWLKSQDKHTAKLQRQGKKLRPLRLDLAENESWMGTIVRIDKGQRPVVRAWSQGEPCGMALPADTIG